MKPVDSEGYEVLFGLVEGAVWVFLWLVVLVAVLAPLSIALDAAGLAPPLPGKTA